MEEPVEQFGTADAERILKILTRPGAVAVDREREGMNEEFGHGVPFSLVRWDCYLAFIGVLEPRPSLATRRPSAAGRTDDQEGRDRKPGHKAKGPPEARRGTPQADGVDCAARHAEPAAVAIHGQQERDSNHGVRSEGDGVPA